MNVRNLCTNVINAVNKCLEFHEGLQVNSPILLNYISYSVGYLWRRRHRVASLYSVFEILTLKIVFEGRPWISRGQKAGVRALPLRLIFHFPKVKIENQDHANENRGIWNRFALVLSPILLFLPGVLQKKIVLPIFKNVTRNTITNTA